MPDGLTDGDVHAGKHGQVAAQLEEIGKQNMEMFTKAFSSMFTPFGAPVDGGKKKYCREVVVRNRRKKCKYRG